MKRPVPTFEELMTMIDSQGAPNDLGWMIYQFLKANIGASLSSVEVRKLMLIYLRLPLQRPSVLHSMMLNIAIKAVEIYSDFKLPGFLEMWDVRTLAPADFNPQHDAEGREFLPLASRLSICAMRYHMMHPDETFDEATRQLVLKQGHELGYLPALQMVAVKMFETQHGGRKLRMVKLVGPQGQEIAAEWHAFALKPWEITGRMYDVLRRRSSKTDKERVDAISPSMRSMEDVFGRIIGYVDRYDANHKHYHIFDNQGRHLVAEDPRVQVRVGDFVWFSPIIPAEDKFKTAVVHSVASQAEGIEAFGTVEAKVTGVNTERGFISFIAPDGSTGFADLSLCADAKAGDRVRLIIYPRRGKDGNKHPHVALVLK